MIRTSKRPGASNGPACARCAVVPSFDLRNKFYKVVITKDSLAAPRPDLIGLAVAIYGENLPRHVSKNPATWNSTFEGAKRSATTASDRCTGHVMSRGLETEIEIRVISRQIAGYIWRRSTAFREVTRWATMMERRDAARWGLNLLALSKPAMGECLFRCGSLP